ncbi:transposable element Tcb1 transposase [Trichonephila clavipes]|nr:transposable element Tcb1 transposase [Trichonephila clavipes]
MATGSYMTPIYSRSQSEVLGDHHIQSKGNGTHRQWTPQQWQQVIWSDESTFTLFQTTGRVFVWRTPKEAFAPERIVPTVKHGGGSLMVWGAIFWRGLGPLVTLHGKVKAAHYVNILGDQVHPFVQTSFPEECPLYQDDNAPIHTAKIVQEWFAEYEGQVGHLDCPLSHLI